MTGVHETQAAMGQPRSPYPGYGAMQPHTTPALAKKGCCGCLSVIVLAGGVGLAVAAAALVL